eukprot:COSAG01_NODE_2_length_63927_cov_1357.611941_21_plen_205_part_00
MNLPALDMKVLSLWDTLSRPILNHLKIYLLQHHISDIIARFSTKVLMEVQRYLKSLPKHVAMSEVDDLKTIAQIEFIETLKVWDKTVNEDIWPLARRRILGAMKDHIRYITRTDPSRSYDWIADAAYMYEVVEEQASFSQKIETELELKQVMDVLTYREKRVVIAYVKSGLTFKDIGISLGVSESQVSRIYKKSLEKMQKLFKA